MGLCEAEVRKNIVLVETGGELTLPLRTLNENCEFRKVWNKTYNKWHPDPEVKAKKNAYKKAYNQKPEVKTKVKAYHKAYQKAYNQKPEVKAKAKAYKKAYYQMKKARGEA